MPRRSSRCSSSCSLCRLFLDLPSCTATLSARQVTTQGSSLAVAPSRSQASGSLLVVDRADMMTMMTRMMKTASQNQTKLSTSTTSDTAIQSTATATRLAAVTRPRRQFGPPRPLSTSSKSTPSTRTKTAPQPPQ
ncbi:hypothetical protein C7974DRAFT_397878 [Boeremia exigua]|uniref:uncharacterized protein n=1 Tax=Boeremia exigua TaxID=749465 RepID=UPI001E8D0991|nr:uncharacterized protein C7974DRAFT_397878 [Boeremia exigua]KAH6622213.1 hypothetical protein C7974DRAFT_397878 [Boeremia exigua]